MTQPQSQTQPQLRSSLNNNLHSSLLLQPQNLQHLTGLSQQQSYTNIEATASTASLQPRSYSASSEMLLSNAQYNFLNQNTRALVGSPIRQYYNTRSNFKQPQQQQGRANSSASAMYHPYHQLPGASLSLQTLNLNGKNNSGCVYLRPEQNIPEVFANPGTVFKPIDEVLDANDLNDNDQDHTNSRHSRQVLEENSGAISRDDIVVTMRSVHV